MNNSALAERLLNWNKIHLTANADLTKAKIAELFAENFTVIANERVHPANYDNYFDFLNSFRATIQSIDYEYTNIICDNEYAVIPLTAYITRTDNTTEKFVAILILKFDSDSKIILWQEVYSRV